MKKILALATSLIMVITMTACSSVNQDDVVATVNGKDVTVGEYEKTLAIYKQSIEAMYGTSIWDQEVEKGVKYRDKFKEIILQQVIDTQAVYDVAKKENILPTEDEVNKSFEQLKQSMETQKEYKKQLEEAGVNDAFLKSQQEKDLAWQKYKANFDKDTTVTDKEIKDYYEKNKTEFYKDEVEASHILISNLDENNKPLPDKKKEEAKKKAEDVLKKAQSGEDFAELAKKYSDDTGSAVNGGDLGFFGRGRMVAPFEEAAFSLKKGELSEIVETTYGYHIIKVTDKVNEQVPFEEVKDSIKENLLYQKYTENIKKITKAAKVEKHEDIIKKIKF